MYNGSLLRKDKRCVLPYYRRDLVDATSSSKVVEAFKLFKFLVVVICQWISSKSLKAECG
jgi:hypothetical protein